MKTGRYAVKCLRFFPIFTFSTKAISSCAAHLLQHLGHFTQEHTPAGRGFDTFFGFLFGSETHDTHNSYGRHTCKISMTDLYNTTHRANESVHYTNMTYSPEMYGREMDRLIKAHPATLPFFLYMVRFRLNIAACNGSDPFCG